MMIVQTVFWLSLLAVALTYFIYPAVLWVLARRPRPVQTSDETPSVSLVISAYNEEAVIREKVLNALQLDYPHELLEVIVISDASSDATDQIVGSIQGPRVKLYRQEVRKGKSAGLTEFVPRAKGRVLVFSDANSIYQRDAIRCLVRHFGDPQVGFVVGHQRYVPERTSSSSSESLYWRYETAIKVLEGQTGSVVCGDGAIYAVRAELFEPLLPDDISDFTLPLRIAVRGFRGVFDKEAVCYEHAASTFTGEFRRKVRIVTRSLLAVLRVRGCLNPFRTGAFALRLAVHKVLRWLVPFFLVAALTSGTALALQGIILYQVLTAVQLAFYLLAALYAVPILRTWKPVYVAYYFCLVNLAATLGVCRVLMGRTVSIWQPERPPEGANQKERPQFSESDAAASAKV